MHDKNYDKIGVTLTEEEMKENCDKYACFECPDSFRCPFFYAIFDDSITWSK